MAIQVSGTEVISNARALTNIASVDATTKASIEAAGVGGLWVDLGTTTTGSNASYLEFTFSAPYIAYKIVLQNILPTASAEWWVQFTDSSGSPITGQEYGYYFSGYGPGFNGAGSGPINVLTDLEVAGGPSGLDNGWMTGVLEVYTPWETNTRSFFRFDIPFSYNGTNFRPRSGAVYMKNKKRTNSMRFYFLRYDATPINTAAGAIYTVYGLKA